MATLKRRNLLRGRNKHIFMVCSTEFWALLGEWPMLRMPTETDPLYDCVSDLVCCNCIVQNGFAHIIA